MGDMEPKGDKLNLAQLAAAIRRIHKELTLQTHRAVNISLTLRNWLIGYYIAEYELNGADRAVYGEHILEELATRLNDVSNCNRRQLYRYLRFYRVYPEIVGTLSPQFQRLLPVPTHLKKMEAVSPQSSDLCAPILEFLSYSHIEQLVEIEDKTKRLFYQVECIRGNWSLRTLKRQISSFYYERAGLSIDKKKLSESTNKSAEYNSMNLCILGWVNIFFNTKFAKHYGILWRKRGRRAAGE